MIRRVSVLAVVLVALGGASAAAPASQGTFFVGFTEDLPKEIGTQATAPMADLGAGAFRITLMWSPGQTQLLDGDRAKLDRAVGAASGMRVVLAVYAAAASSAPADSAARDAYCTYVRNVLGRYAAIRDVVIWNEPNKSFFWTPQLNADGSSAAPAAYQALLARCWDVLHAFAPNVNVIGLALSPNGNDNAGSHSPGAFIRGVGEAYRASGRQQPILDTVAHHAYGLDPSERPWRKHIGSKVIAQGDWNKLMYNVWLAFDGTAQPIPGECGSNGCVAIWYTEAGFQTTVDTAKAGAYSGSENVAGLVQDDAGGEPDSPPPGEATAAPDQRTQILDAVRLAYCQPYVGAFFNFLLADEPVLAGWQSGAYWADRTPKDSLPAFADAIAAANAGAVDCDALKGGRPSPDYLPPSVPTDVQATALRDPLRVEVRWSASTDDASPISYRVYRNGAYVGFTAATSWTNTAVAGGTTYTYTVRAIDSAGNLGNPSAPVTVTTPDVTPPSTPTGLAAQALTNPGRVQLTWNASTDNVGVAEYDVYRDGALIASTATTGFTDGNVAGRTTYGYSVVARDAAGNRSAAASVTVTTPDLTPPTAPTGLTASPYGDRVELAWAASSDDVGVTGYEVSRDGVVVATVTAGSYVDRAVVQGRTYAYAVRAVDAAGNRSAAATASARVPDTVAPSVPTGLVGTPLSYPVRVRLTWTASTDNVAVAGYRVLRNGVQIATATGTSYVDAAVARRTTYRYALVAFDAAGNASAQSASISVTTKRR